jgi:hypothetical protein
MTTIYLRPVDPTARVLYPDGIRVLPAGGAYVPEDRYWRRRILSGEVEESTPGGGAAETPPLAVPLLIVDGAPTDNFGQDGDVVLDPATNLIYGPKAGGEWPGGESLGGELAPPVNLTSPGSAAANTALIQAALTAGGDVRLYGSGVVDINDRLLIGSNTHLKLDPRLTLRQTVAGKGMLRARQEATATRVTISGITAAADLVTVTTVTAHGYAVNDAVAVENVLARGYNGVWRVASVPSLTSFTYLTDIPPRLITKTGLSGLTATAGSYRLSGLGNAADVSDLLLWIDWGAKIADTRLPTDTFIRDWNAGANRDLVQACTYSNGNAVVSGFGSGVVNAQLFPGMTVTGTGVSTTILSTDAIANTITLANAPSSGGSSLTFTVLGDYVYISKPASTSGTLDAITLSPMHFADGYINAMYTRPADVDISVEGGTWDFDGTTNSGLTGLDHWPGNVTWYLVNILGFKSRKTKFKSTEDDEYSISIWPGNIFEFDIEDMEVIDQRTLVQWQGGGRNTRMKHCRGKGIDDDFIAIIPILAGELYPLETMAIGDHTGIRIEDVVSDSPFGTVVFYNTDGKAHGRTPFLFDAEVDNAAGGKNCVKVQSGTGVSRMSRLMCRRVKPVTKWNGVDYEGYGVSVYGAYIDVLDIELDPHQEVPGAAEAVTPIIISNANAGPKSIRQLTIRGMYSSNQMPRHSAGYALLAANYVANLIVDGFLFESPIPATTSYGTKQVRGMGLDGQFDTVSINNFHFAGDSEYGSSGIDFNSTFASVMPVTLNNVTGGGALYSLFYVNANMAVDMQNVGIRDTGASHFLFNVASGKILTLFGSAQYADGKLTQDGTTGTLVIKSPGIKVNATNANVSDAVGNICYHKGANEGIAVGAGSAHYVLGIGASGASVAAS